MNKKELYESIMRQVSIEVKKALNEAVEEQTSNEFVIMDTRNNNGLAYEDYVEDCEADETTPASEESQEYQDWLTNMIDFEYDEFMRGVENCKINYPLLITGSLGTWQGKKEINPVYIESDNKYNSIYKAIGKCLKSADDTVIKFNNGVIEVSAMHHDGTNVFEIHKLSNYGIDQFDECEDCEPTDEWFEPIKEDELW